MGQVTVQRLSEMASLLGLELSLRFYPIGDPVRDKGQLALGKRFGGLLSDRWRVTDEALLPGAGVVSNSAANRTLAEQLRAALGNAYLNDANEIVRQLKAGEQLVGSGVVLL